MGRDRADQDQQRHRNGGADRPYIQPANEIATNTATVLRARRRGSTSITSDGSRQGSLVEYGPFIRMAYNFAGPSRSRRMAVREEREIWTNAPPTGSPRHVVHFGYERSDINLVAASAIRQAAEDVRRGRPANIAIASTDPENGSPYSRALSQRRAEAIRQALAQEGVAPGQIDIAVSGEVAPSGARRRWRAGGQKQTGTDTF